MKEIRLSQGKVTIVDDEDWPNVARVMWSAFRSPAGHWYARRLDRGVSMYLHRLLLNAQKGELVDHINGNSLDNRRSNLRKADKSINAQNTRGWRRRSAPYKGIFFDQRSPAWVARIGVRGRYLHLGRFRTPEEAARAYDAAARTHYGPHAGCNFPEI